MSALWALDEQLGAIVATTTQPMVGQMRLTWWYDALIAGSGGTPVLDALTEPTLAQSITRRELATFVEGWEHLLDPLPLDAAALTSYANARGDGLFAMTGRLLGHEVEPGPGAGWALADFAGRCSDRTTADRAFALARSIPPGCSPLPRALRILARLARDDANAGARLPRTRFRLFRASL